MKELVIIGGIVLGVLGLLPVIVSMFLRDVEAGTIRLVSWLQGSTITYRGPGKSKEIPLLTRLRVTGPKRRASAIALSRMARRSAVISSASISLSPSPNRCGASRLSGRVATSPPKPADPRGRAWQPAQLSDSPAPMLGSLAMSPNPSLVTVTSARSFRRW